jgi:phenolic acid decarboxylase
MSGLQVQNWNYVPFGSADDYTQWVCRELELVCKIEDCFMDLITEMQETGECLKFAKTDMSHEFYMRATGSGDPYVVTMAYYYECTAYIDGIIRIRRLTLE